MRSCVWEALLRRIPAEQHNILMLVTKGGQEIALQNILRLDEEVLIIRGRLAGSQDSGRLYFVPLDNIDYFGFNRIIKEEEYQAMFGDFQLPPQAAAVAPAPPPPAPAPVVIVETPPSAAVTPPDGTPLTPPPGSPLRSTLPIKSTVLERFRSRSLGPSGSNPPSE